MKEVTERLLKDLHQAFTEANRVGNLVDIPEGSRCISISDTLASELSGRIVEALEQENCPL